MQNISNKSDGSTTLTASEFNSMLDELENIVNTSSQTLSGSDEFQLSKSIAAYAAVADFYTDSGTANAYVLTSVGSLKSPNQYYNGMRVRFYVGNPNTGASTVNVASLGAVAIKKTNATTALDQGDLTASQYVEIVYNSSLGCFNLVTQVSAGGLVQFQSFETGAVATGTTILPYDDTIPQNTEGDQYMSLSITPTHAANTLIIDVVIHLASNVPGTVIPHFAAALFQDSTANALAVGAQVCGIDADQPQQINFRHVMLAGTTSATTFKVRGGIDLAATTTFNGGTSAGSRKYGGALASSITIMEIES